MQKYEAIQIQFNTMWSMKYNAIGKQNKTKQQQQKALMRHFQTAQSAYK